MSAATVCLTSSPSAASSFCRHTLSRSEGSCAPRWEITGKEHGLHRLWTHPPSPRTTNHFDVTRNPGCVRSRIARLVLFLSCAVCLSGHFPFIFDLMLSNSDWNFKVPPHWSFRKWFLVADKKKRHAVKSMYNLSAQDKVKHWGNLGFKRLARAGRTRARLVNVPLCML